MIFKLWPGLARRRSFYHIIMVRHKNRQLLKKCRERRFSMLLSLLGLTAANVIYLILHVTNSGSFPRPLTAAEEKHYLDLLKSGDKSAKNVLIEHNLRLVAHIIKKYYSNARDQDDLISIGTIGLIKAISTFNSDKGTRLATYAARCIENAILTLRKHSIHRISVLNQWRSVPLISAGKYDITAI